MLASVLIVFLLGHVSLAREIEISAEEDSAMLDMIIAAGDRGELSMDEPEYLDYLRATGRHEEFAKMMGIEDVSLVIPSESARSEDFIFSRVSPLGDILLTPKQAEQARQGMNFSNNPEGRWLNNILPYTIALLGFTTSQRNRITTAIREMDSNLNNLKIVQRGSERDYVYIFSGRGCYSNLGRTGGRQSISLQSTGCLSNGTIQHEVTHAAGVIHEHNRPDRDDQVRVIWENIPPNWHSQYQKVNEEDFGIHGPYEYCSVMHYPLNAPSSNRPAFEILNKTEDHDCMGQRIGLTATDYQKLEELYSEW